MEDGAWCWQLGEKAEVKSSPRCIMQTETTLTSLIYASLRIRVHTQENAQLYFVVATFTLTMGSCYGPAPTSPFQCTPLCSLPKLSCTHCPFHMHLFTIRARKDTPSPDGDGFFVVLRAVSIPISLLTKTIANTHLDGFNQTH